MSETNNNSTKLLIGLIALLLIVVFLIWKTFELSGKNDELTYSFNQKVNESELLEKRLDASMDSLLTYKGLNEEMDSIIDVKLNEIKNMKSRLKSADFKISDLKNQLSHLEAIQQATIDQLDSIMVVNDLLKEENQTLHRNVKNYQERTTRLTLENTHLNTQVQQAEILVANNIRCTSQRRKGSGKIVESSKAKKVNRIEVCLDLIQNNVTKAGKKDLFLVLKDPKNKVLTIENLGSEKVRAMSGDREIVYTTKKTVIYQNETVPVCVSWEQDKVFATGRYISDIYSEGHKIGTCSFFLK